MIKGYSGVASCSGKRDAKKIAASWRKRGYGARVEPKTGTIEDTGKKIKGYVVLRSDKKLKR